MADREGDTGSTRNPEWPEIIDRAMANYAWGLHTMMPAVVTKYDASKSKVSVKPLLMRSSVDEEGVRTAQEYQIVNGVPVSWLGAGGFRFTCPISDGTLVIDGAQIPATTGMLVFCERSMDKWLTGSGGAVDPLVDHSHTLDDAVFVPGLRPFGSTWSSMPTDHATAGADDGVQIHFHKQIIAAGDEAGNDFVALAQKVLANFNTLFNLLDGVFGNTSTVLLTTAPASPDAVYVAMKAAIAALVIAGGQWPAQPVAAQQFKAK